MKYLYSWLKELYPALPVIETLETQLIQLGHDVESIESVSYNGCVVAEIRNVEKHPNADRLTVTEVWDGEASHQVVCGAPNVEVGLKVIYARPGTTLPSGLTLRTLKVRGIESDGMLCAEDELGSGSSHEGLVIVPADAVPGTASDTYLAKDFVLSLDITPNRGDVLSHYGLVRDIAALNDKHLLMPSLHKPTYSAKTADSVAVSDIHADAEALSLGLVTCEQLASTPLFIQSRLFLMGQKPINLPTDITNYLLLGYGQPMHAYDADTLGEKPTFGIRRAKTGESLHGLNGATYTLSPQTLVITSDDTAISLAGILGGDDTKVTNDTKRVIFEAASFHTKAIRLASRGLGLTTESAHRFERGTDPTLRTALLEYAQYLLASLSNGVAYEPVTTESGKHHHPQTRLDYDRITRRIGMSVEKGTVKTSLLSLGCTITDENESGITLEPPLWRHDLVLFEDYLEEIVRLIGLNHITKSPLSASVPQWKRSRFWRIESVKDTLVALGAYEYLSYPFVTLDELNITGNPESALTLEGKPLQDKTHMRISLLPGLLTTLATNPEVPTLALFEVAKIYFEAGEQRTIIIGVSSNTENEIDDWWQNLFERMRLPVGSWMSRLKKVPTEVVSQYKIRKAHTVYLELPVEDFTNTKGFDIPNVVIPDLDTVDYTPVSKYQASRRDIAVIVDTTVNVTTLANEITRLDDIISGVELFDQYQDTAKLGEGKQSVAFHILYQATDRTLTSEELNHLHTRVEDFIKEHYHGIIR